MSAGSSNNLRHHRPHEWQDDDNPNVHHANGKKQKLLGQTTDLQEGQHDVAMATDNGQQALERQWNANSTMQPQGQFQRIDGKLVAVRPPAVTEDENMDEEALLNEIEDNDAEDAAEQEWHEVHRVKDRFYMAFIEASTLSEGTRKAQEEELRELAWSLKANITDGPHPCTRDGVPGFKVSVENEQDLLQLLGQQLTITDEDNNVQVKNMFTRMDNSRRESELERTVEVSGLHPRTELDRIKSAFVRFGEVERVTTRPQREGLRMSARVLFNSGDSLQDIRSKGVQYVQVGNDLVRLSWIGRDRLTWDLSFSAKLTGLRRKMHSADLIALIGQDKASFVQVPWVGREGQKDTYQLREAYVYFPTQEMMDSVTKSGVRIADGRGTTLQWVGLQEKRCYECGAADHTQWKCPKAMREKEDNKHKRMVQAFAKGKAIRVVTRRSFAEVTRGELSTEVENGNKPTETQNTGHHQPTGGEKKKQEVQKDASGNGNKTQGKDEGTTTKEMMTEIRRLQESNNNLMKSFKDMFDMFMKFMMITMTMDRGNSSVSGNAKMSQDKKQGKGSKDIPPMENMMADLLKMASTIRAAETQRPKVKLPGTPQHKMEPHIHSESNE